MQKCQFEENRTVSPSQFIGDIKGSRSSYDFSNHFLNQPKKAESEELKFPKFFFGLQPSPDDENV